MACILVTREVSQLEMSSLNPPQIEKKSLLMSVTRETHQSAAGPYLATPAARFPLYNTTAVFRSALLVNVLRPVQAGGEGEGELGEGGGGLGDGGGGDGEGGEEGGAAGGQNWQQLSLASLPSTPTMCEPPML